MLGHAPAKTQTSGITRKQWNTDFQTELTKIESEFKNTEVKPEETELLNDMKAICSKLLAAEDAEPGFLGAPTTTTMKLINDAKTLGKKYFDDNDQLKGNVPTGPLALRIFKSYGEYTAKWPSVSNKPWGSSVLAPDYVKRAASILEFNKSPQAYIAKMNKTPTLTVTKVGF